MPSPYEIATFRFEQIAPLIDPSLDDTQRKAALRDRYKKRVEWPGSQERKRRGKPAVVKPVPKSTLHRWVQAFRAHGYEGLLPKPRKDRGFSRQAGHREWTAYAIALLYELPSRSLTQLAVYLRAEFANYSWSRSTLDRRLRAHPAFAGIAALKDRKGRKLRDRYEAQHPHESWQLDGKGPFRVRFTDGKTIEVHVLSILDDYSRAILAAVVALAESIEAAIAVFEKAAALWGLPDRMQFDRGSAFDSHAFRKGLAQLGVHRGFVKAKSPQNQGKIEAYHRPLTRWFVDELRAQQVIDLEHLQELLEAMLALVYNTHPHRETKTSPKKRLADRQSSRRVSQQDLARAFFVEATAKSDAGTGEVKLASGRFRVPNTFAGQRSRFLYHPARVGRAVLIATDGREIELQPFAKKTVAELRQREEKRGTGQLQKLVDLWRGSERPNAQPGFGLPEVFGELSRLVDRELPQSEQEALLVLAFYRRHGPLPREAFTVAVTRTARALGSGRPITAYLDDIERQIVAAGEAPPKERENQ